MEISVATPTYTAPPIIEAVVQLTYESALVPAIYRKVAQRLTRDYHSRATVNIATANINFDSKDFSFEPDEDQDRFSSVDETDIFVMQGSSYSWSKLAPYKGCQEFCARINSDLGAISSLTGPRRPNRIGMRFINRIDVPFNGTTADYEKYLAINLSLPSGIDIVQNYGWRFEHWVNEFELMAIVQSATAAPEIPNTAAFLLDIDIVDLPTNLIRNEQVLDRLQVMRTVKNQMFELSITEQAREVFTR